MLPDGLLALTLSSGQRSARNRRLAIFPSRFDESLDVRRWSGSPHWPVRCSAIGPANNQDRRWGHEDDHPARTTRADARTRVSPPVPAPTDQRERRSVGALVRPSRGTAPVRRSLLDPPRTASHRPTPGHHIPRQDRPAFARMDRPRRKAIACSFHRRRRPRPVGAPRSRSMAARLRSRHQQRRVDRPHSTIRPNATRGHDRVHSERHLCQLTSGQILPSAAYGRQVASPCGSVAGSSALPSNSTLPSPSASASNRS